MTRLLALGVIFALARGAYADYVVVTHDANIYEEPYARSRVLASAGAGDEMELVTPRSRSGYYLVRFAEDEQSIGYVYRHFIRARRGDPGFVFRRSEGRPSEGSTARRARPRGNGVTPGGAFNQCPLAGDVSPNNPERASLEELNRNKNRTDAPSAEQIDHSVTLDAILADPDQPARERQRFKVGTAARITGYVYDVKVGGVETANCHARQQIDRDTHIEIVTGSDDASPGRRVIVEVTPRTRAQAAARRLDWSTDALQREILGRTITVTGWMLYDFEHENASEHTVPGNPGNWRATAWEIHPVVDLVLGGEPIASR